MVILPQRLGRRTKSTLPLMPFAQLDEEKGAHGFQRSTVVVDGVDFWRDELCHQSDNSRPVGTEEPSTTTLRNPLEGI